MISEFHEHFIGIEIGNKPAPAADGYFTLRIPDLSDSGWAKLAKLMDRGDLVQDPQFATAPARKQHRSDLYELIRSWIATKTRQELWDGLRAIDYFGAPVLSMGEVIEDPHIKEERRLSNVITRRQDRPRCWHHGFICPRRRQAYGAILRPANTRMKFWAGYSALARRT